MFGSVSAQGVVEVTAHSRQHVACAGPAEGARRAGHPGGHIAHDLHRHVEGSLPAPRHNLLNPIPNPNPGGHIAHDLHRHVEGLLPCPCQRLHYALACLIEDEQSGEALRLAHLQALQMSGSKSG